MGLVCSSGEMGSSEVCQECGAFWKKWVSWAVSGAMRVRVRVAVRASSNIVHFATKSGPYVCSLFRTFVSRSMTVNNSAAIDGMTKPHFVYTYTAVDDLMLEP